MQSFQFSTLFASLPCKFFFYLIVVGFVGTCGISLTNLVCSRDRRPPVVRECDVRRALAPEVMFIKGGPAAGDQERRGSVSNWFSSLRRGGRRKREEIAAAPSSYGSLGRRKDGAQPRGKTRSAWDLTTVSRLVCISHSTIIKL